MPGRGGKSCRRVFWGDGPYFDGLPKPQWAANAGATIASCPGTDAGGDTPTSPTRGGESRGFTGLLGAPFLLRGLTRPFRGTAPRENPQGPPLPSHLGTTHMGSVGGCTEFGRAQRGAPNPPSPYESRVPPPGSRRGGRFAPRASRRLPAVPVPGTEGLGDGPGTPSAPPGPSPSPLAAPVPQALPPVQAPVPPAQHCPAAQRWKLRGLWGGGVSGQVLSRKQQRSPRKAAR